LTDVKICSGGGPRRRAKPTELVPALPGTSFSCLDKVKLRGSPGRRAEPTSEARRYGKRPRPAVRLGSSATFVAPKNTSTFPQWHVALVGAARFASSQRSPGGGPGRPRWLADIRLGSRRALTAFIFAKWSPRDRRCFPVKSATHRIFFPESRAGKPLCDQRYFPLWAAWRSADRRGGRWRRREPAKNSNLLFIHRRHISAS